MHDYGMSIYIHTYAHIPIGMDWSSSCWQHSQSALA